MLDRVLTTADSAPEIDRVLLVSPERDEVPAYFRHVRDSGVGVNAAFKRAGREAFAGGATAILLLPADLPEVTPTDLRAMVQGGRENGLAIAPDRAGTGTNALFIHETCSKFVPAFGADSRRKHEQGARDLNVTPAIIERAGLARDVDTLTDWVRYHRRRRMSTDAGDRELRETPICVP